jgi:hypothetical protein
MAMNDPSQFDKMDWISDESEQKFTKFAELPAELQNHVLAFSKQSVGNLRSVSREFNQRFANDPAERLVRQTAATLAELYGDKVFGGPWNVHERYKDARDRDDFIEDTTHLLDRIEPIRQILPKDHNLRTAASFVVSHIGASDQMLVRETRVMKLSKLNSHLQDIYKNQQHFAIDSACTHLDSSAYKDRWYKPQGHNKPFSKDDAAAAKVLWHLRGEVSEILDKGSPFPKHSGLQNKISNLVNDPDTKKFIDEEFKELKAAQEMRRDTRYERSQKPSSDIPRAENIRGRIEEVFKESNYWDGQRPDQEAYAMQQRDMSAVMEEIWDVCMSGPHQRSIDASKEVSNETKRGVFDGSGARTEMIKSRSRTPSDFER